MSNDYQTGGQKGSSRDEDLTLAKLVARNDPNAVSKLFDTYNDNVSRYISTVAPRITDADRQDIVQDTFIAVLQSVKDYRGDSSLSTWILRIAYFKAIDVLRKHKSLDKSEAPLLDMVTEEEISFVDPSGSAEDMAIVNEEVNRIHAALQQLPEEQRQVLVLRYVMGMRVEDVADTMKLSRRMVELHITRGRAALRKHLQGEDGLGEWINS